MGDQTYDGWAIVEIMGHRVRAGLVVMDDSPTIRIDIPTDSGDVTEFYGRAAIFSLRPCTEDVARAAAKGFGDPRPIRPVDYRPEPPRLPFSEYIFVEDDKTVDDCWGRPLEFDELGCDPIEGEN